MWAGVLAHGTPDRLGGFLLRIVDVVPGIGRGARLALEGVQEAEPVPDLVNGRAAQVVAVKGAAWHAARENVAAVVDV